MKVDKNFKLSKAAKCVLATLLTKEERSSWKKAFIHAESNTSDRMAMDYDITSSGKKPRKAQQQENRDE